MKRLILTIFILSFTAFSLAGEIDINNQPPEVLDTMLLPDEVIEGIKDYMYYHGEIQSIYELRDIEGVDTEIFNILKDKIVIYPDTATDQTSIWVMRLQERLASEESPTQGAIDLWEDLLIHKLNINTATLDQLLQIHNVNITDAAAIIRAQKRYGGFGYEGHVRSVQGLTYYAWTQIRNYITFDEPEDPWAFSGYLRSQLRYTNDDTYNYTSYTALGYQLENAIKLLNVAGSDSTNVRDQLIEAGVSEYEIESIKSRMSSELEDIRNKEMDGDFVNKLKLRLGKHISAGGLFVKYAGIEEYRYKMYASMKDMPYSPDIIIGNFRVSAGQGLVLDNTDEYRARRYDVINGVFPDVIESYGSAFNGIALNGSLGRLDYTAFGSSMKRNALLNPDSTVNMLILQRTFFNAFENNVGELTGGGRVTLNLGGFMDMPISTRIGVTGYRSMYDRKLNPDTVIIDIPFDKDNISDPVFTESFRGKTRTVYGVDFRTDYRNMSFEGEVAKQLDAYAYVLRNDIVFDNFYLRTIYRHYDAGFDNPFARPISEQSRFDDTSFEKEYRLVDPILTIMTDDPRPKPEEGIYFETRYRLTEQLTLNKVYLDIWRTLDYNLTNYRFQGTIEYRPVFPLRIRLKQKIQEKNLAKIAVSTHSVTNETTLRIFALLSNNDYLNLEARYGRVNLTPSLMYGENYIIDGTYLNVSFEHEMTDYFSVLSGIATWQTGGMSQWIFEDTGIDFLYGNGQKLYVTMIDRVSDNISVRAKASLKNQDIPHTGIYNPDSEYHYYEEDEQFMRDFIEYNNLFNLEIRLDFRW